MEEWFINILSEVSLAVAILIIWAYQSRQSNENQRQENDQRHQEVMKQQETVAATLGVVTSTMEIMANAARRMADSTEQIRAFSESISQTITAMPDYQRIAAQQRQTFFTSTMKKIEETNTNLDKRFADVISKLAEVSELVKSQAIEYEAKAEERSKKAEDSSKKIIGLLEGAIIQLGRIADRPVIIPEDTAGETSEPQPEAKPEAPETNPT